VEQNKREREEFKTLVNTQFRPEQLVFANGSHFDRLLSRRPYMWSKHNERPCRYEFLLRGTKYSLIPALSLDGILHLEVVDKAITADDFRRFVQGLLPLMNEWPQPRSVLVIDDASIHKAARIREMVEERGARLLYLPANSPDFNPTEHAFSTIESWLRSNCDGVNQETESKNGAVKDAFSEAVHSVTAEDAKGYFRDCGYNVPI
jgi:transposase